MHNPTMGSNKIFDLLIPWPASFEHFVAGVQDPEAKPKTHNNILPKGHVFFASNCIHNLKVPCQTSSLIFFPQ